MLSAQRDSVRLLQGVLVASVVTGRLGGKAPKFRILLGSAVLIVAALLLL